MSAPAGSESGPASRLARLIEEAGSVVALTGAGISVPSGIPDFRSPGTGLWANVNPMEVAHIEAFRRDPVSFWSFYGQRFQTLEDKRPNRAHAALAAWRGSAARATLRGQMTGFAELPRYLADRAPVQRHKRVSDQTLYALLAPAPT